MNINKTNQQLIKKDMEIYLANPRGFCAGVDRAINIVEKSLEYCIRHNITKNGKPNLFVFHQIVHNAHVVNDFERRGVIFIEDVDDVPDESVLVLSAHGVSSAVENAAKNRNITVFDATCPLVKKVHFEAQKYDTTGKQVILIGHAGHAEVKGTTGRIESDMILVQCLEDVKNITVKDPDNLAYITQTTLSVDDTKNIIDALHAIFPNITGPNKEDICYATQNRQDAVKELSKFVNILLVVGSKNSSNSNRLRELAIKMGVDNAYLIDDYTDIDLSWFNNIKCVGITAGASAPEELVQEIINYLSNNFSTNVQNIIGAEENIKFKIPSALINE